MFRSLVLLFVSLFAGQALAASPAAPGPTPPLPVPVPPMSPIGAKSYVLMDYRTGQILAEKDPDERRAPASTTKLMTAYVVFQDLKAGRITLDTKFHVSDKAWRQGGSRMFLNPGSSVSVKELLQGLLVPSGNDAAVALAQGVAGTTGAFVSLMNAYAKQLGLANTHYSDVNGLPEPDLYTSALDLAKLSRAIITQFPEYYHFFSEKSFTWNKIKQYNYNKLLWRDPSVDGLKTGYTSEAGYILASSAVRNDTRLIAVVMGVNLPKASSEQNYINLARVSEALLNYGFRFFSTHKLYSAGQSLNTARVWGGAHEHVKLGLMRDLYVTVPSGQYRNLKAEMTLDPTLKAPIAKGQTVGEVKVSLAGKPVAQVPLVALEADPEGNLWQRVRDTVLQWFEHK
ncbi:D-alanyl-D-alanine carboxypeptidase [Acidihalobacter prosperus]|uniref:serine-type D-Ala-D-Ala carboxypeptidase n=1 Tax=Acidihalobacter prosperus TaxID=160660 RepID=A0A1A6C6H2_9GAMM|nr:D-alanyl-D-alanine carboxypeptidase [Acidihalobacter prosperus]